VIEAIRKTLEDVQRALDWRLFQVGETVFTSRRVLLVLALLFAIFWMTGWARRWTIRRLTHRRGVSMGVAHAVGSILRYGMVFVGLVVLPDTIGLDLSSLAFVTGALGIGVGLGLRDITNNFLSGLILLIERPIKVGDRIEVGELRGDVRGIAPRATTIVTNDNIAVIVPNSHFVSSPVVNWSHGETDVRIGIPVPVGYSSDPETVKSVLLSVAAAHAGVLTEPRADVLFERFGDSALEFLLRVWTRDYTARPGVLRSDLNYAINQALRDAGIEIPFPQRTLHIRSILPSAAS
jgi:small-conductance mechanosensitive channel